MNKLYLFIFQSNIYLIISIYEIEICWEHWLNNIFAMFSHHVPINFSKKCNDKENRYYCLSRPTILAKLHVLVENCIYIFKEDVMPKLKEHKLEYWFKVISYHPLIWENTYHKWTESQRDYNLQNIKNL